MLDFYKERGITCVHFPIHDFNEADLTSKLEEGAAILKDMIEV